VYNVKDGSNANVDAKPKTCEYAYENACECVNTCISECVWVCICVCMY